MVRIAVVEGEAVSRQLLADYIARYSEENNVPFEVTYFEDGGAIIGDYKPVYDIILMDIQMTHVDGMTAARAIREVDQEVVLVFITSAAQFAIHGYQVGAATIVLTTVKGEWRGSARCWIGLLWPDVRPRGRGAIRHERDRH